MASGTSPMTRLFIPGPPSLRLRVYQRSRQGSLLLRASVLKESGELDFPEPITTATHPPRSPLFALCHTALGHLTSAPAGEQCHHHPISQKRKHKPRETNSCARRQATNKGLLCNFSSIYLAILHLCLLMSDTSARPSHAGRRQRSQDFKPGFSDFRPGALTF